MSTYLPNAIIYVLGFIGLPAIGLLPLRSWQALKTLLVQKPLMPRGRALAAVAAVAGAFALWIDLQTVARLFNCLTGTYCGPGIASGWTYLAMFGLVYVVFELVFWVLRRANTSHTVKNHGVPG